MALYGVKIQRGNIGAGVSGMPFRTSALLTTGEAVADKLELGKVYELMNVNDMVALGLDDNYDSANDVIVAEHVREYFRMSGGGAKLYLMVAPLGTELDDLIEDEDFAKKLITEAKGEIYNLAIGFNIDPEDDEYEEVHTDGMLSEVRAALVKAQALYDWADNTFRPIQILLEGRSHTGTAAASLNLRAIPATPSGILELNRVSVVIGQDWEYADSFEDSHCQKYAAIGTALGTLAALEINENIGEIDRRNLTDELRSKWLIAGLSSHSTIEDVEVQAQLETFDAKGYIFPMLYVGISGYRWNDDHVCAPVIVDAEGNMNEHTIAYARTLDFCKRELRKALLPQVKKVKPVDAATGKLPTGIVKEFEGYGNTVFEDMFAAGRISSGVTTVDKNSDLLVEKVLKVSFRVVPYGNIGAINGTINMRIRN